MKYLLLINKGNGYRCGCCRHEQTETEEVEFETEQALLQYIKEDNEKGKGRYYDTYIFQAFEITKEIQINED